VQGEIKAESNLVGILLLLRTIYPARLKKWDSAIQLQVDRDQSMAKQSFIFWAKSQVE
jgi:hypothetical protein